MNLGAEPKKIAMLGGLVLVGGYVFYSNVLSGPERPKTVEQPVAQAPGPSSVAGRGPASRKTSRIMKSEAWVPRFRLGPRTGLTTLQSIPQ